MRAPGCRLLASDFYRWQKKCMNNRRRGRLQPPDESDHLSGFSRGLTPCSFHTHQGTRFLSHSAVYVALINFDGPTGAEAPSTFLTNSRLHPPPVTSVRAFFRKPFSP